MSSMKPEKKRQHLSAMIDKVGYKLQVLYPRSQFVFPAMVDYFKSQGCSDSELEDASSQKSLGISEPLENNALPNSSTQIFTSNFLASEDLEEK